MPRRRERILGFDRLTGIEIADLADRLVEVWPDEQRAGDAGQARGASSLHPDHAQRRRRMSDHTVTRFDEMPTKLGVFKLARHSLGVTSCGMQVLMAVRVGPATKRRLVPGDDGLRPIIVGGVPGVAWVW